jgi:hypothetical protein
MMPEVWSAVFAGAALLVSVVSVLVAVRANGRADTANRHAERSARAAEKSADEARRSVDIAARSEARHLERNDVEWDSRLVDGVWTITNMGEDDALEVVAVVTVDGERLVQEVGTVDGPGGVIEFDLRERIAAVQEENTRDMSRAAKAGIVHIASSKVMVGDRLLWVTPAGAPRRMVNEPRGISTRRAGRSRADVSSRT